MPVEGSRLIATGRNTSLLLLTALTALVDAPASAQQAHTAARSTNIARSARVITWPEFRSAELQWFDDVDSNHDGTVDAHDYRTWMHARFAHTVPVVALTNPTVTRRAFEAALRRQFEALDTNHDGVLTANELRAGAPESRTTDFGVPDGQAF